MPKFGPNGVKALDSTTTVYRPARLKDTQGEVAFHVLVAMVEERRRNNARIWAVTTALHVITLKAVYPYALRITPLDSIRFKEGTVKLRHGSI